MFTPLNKQVIYACPRNVKQNTWLIPSINSAKIVKSAFEFSFSQTRLLAFQQK